MSTEVPGADLGIGYGTVEHAHTPGWSDGLPVVRATRARVEEFLAATGRPADEVIGRLDHPWREITVEDAAVNAVRAGCLPAYFPLVVAAWDALMLERSLTVGGWQSVGGPTPLIIVNGPVRALLGFNGSGGLVGGGVHANATVARAIALIVRSGLDPSHQVVERASHGLPDRWAMCIGENEEESPWAPLSVDGGVTAGTDAVSATLVRTSELVDNQHTRDPEKLLNDFADTLSGTGSLVLRHAGAAVMFCPEHAQMLARAGMSKDSVRTWLVERCGRTHHDLRRVGKNGIGENGVRFDLPDRHQTGFDPIFASDSPQHLMIAVAGSRNTGVSLVFRMVASWSQVAARIEAPIEPTPPDQRPRQGDSR